MRPLLGAGLFLGLLAGCAGDKAGDDGTASQEGALHEVKIDCAAAAPAQSFDEVRDAVYREGDTLAGLNKVHPRGNLPRRGRLLRSLVDALTGGFSHDLSQILQCSRNFRANPENGDKVIHAPGVCASATWEMDDGAKGTNLNTGATEQSYTGLFAPGTKVNAIVRISSGTNVSDPNARSLKPSWGIAIKLFPVPADQPKTAAETVHLVMFDQSGVAGSSSREMLRSDDPKDPHYFINFMYGSDAFATSSIAIFNKFVTPHEHLGQKLKREARLQALDPVARITEAGTEVPIAEAHYPSIVKIKVADGVPSLDEVAKRAPGQDLTKDFRDQLLSYEDGELVFDVIGDTLARGPEAMKTVDVEGRIGRLKLDHVVASDVCDKQLTFRHRRNGEVFTGWRPN